MLERVGYRGKAIQCGQKLGGADPRCRWGALRNLPDGLGVILPGGLGVILV